MEQFVLMVTAIKNNYETFDADGIGVSNIHDGSEEEKLIFKARLTLMVTM